MHDCELRCERKGTKDHIFVGCPYSYTIWKGLVRRLLGTRANPDWQLSLSLMQRLRLSHLDSVTYEGSNARPHHKKLDNNWTTHSDIWQGIKYALCRDITDGFNFKYIFFNFYFQRNYHKYHINSTTFHIYTNHFYTHFWWRVKDTYTPRIK